MSASPRLMRDTRSSDDVATSLSRYTPIGQIGRGGMAEVILSEMRVGQGATKLVVLKRMWADLATDPEFVKMFVHEARLSARLNHPNVVQTYEVLDDTKRPTISMEYLEGQTLSRILDRLIGETTLDLSRRLHIVASVLAALDYAHELADFDGTPQGVVHRDVNPQNVFVTYTGQVKLLDFGVAKSVAAAYQTRPGSLKGKLGYMAPEQILRAAVDRRSDLFSVGVMLWEMLARRRIWQGVTDGEIVRHLASRLPMPPIPGGVDVPEGIDEICSRALAVHVENRYPSASEFAAAIGRLLEGNDFSHRRRLGKVVSVAFAKDRSARRKLIEDHVAGKTSRVQPADTANPRAPAGSVDEDTMTGVVIPLEECSIVGGTWESLKSSVTPADLRLTARMPPPRQTHFLRLGFAALGTVAVFGLGLWFLHLRSSAAAGSKVSGEAVADTRVEKAVSIPAPNAAIIIAPMASADPIVIPIVSPSPETAEVKPALETAEVKPALRKLNDFGARGGFDRARRVGRAPKVEPDGSDTVVAQSHDAEAGEAESQHLQHPSSHDAVSQRASARDDYDNILQPSEDLSAVTVIPERTVAPSSRLAHRSTFRPIDDSDPFQP